MVLYSFVSCAFACHVDRNTEPLACYLSIATLMGDNMIVNRVYNSCLINFRDKEFIIELLPIPMQDFDVILGLNCLATYHASVDCFSEEILNILGESELRFQAK